MANKKTLPASNKRDFVSAARMAGVVKNYDLGGGATVGSTGAITQGGIVGSLTPQSSFQAGQAPIQTTNYAPAMGTGLGAINAGAGQVQGVIGQEQGLLGQLMAEGQGQGPNPAQAQLAQNTATNVANQAALMAGQRGAGANAGLMARQAAQQGAATQQNAVGQAATLQAQQELAAQQNAAALQGQVAGQVAGQQQIGANLYGTAVGGQNTQNQAILTNTLTPEQINAQTAAANSGQTGTMLGKLAGGSASGISSMTPMAAMFAQGGEVSPHTTPSFEGATMADGGPVSFAGQYLRGMAKGGKVEKKVPAMLSPGEQYLPPKKAEAVAEGKAHPMSGKKVPGKAKVSGDSLKNDTVPAVLEEGGVVVKRSVMNTKDPEQVKRFVQAIQAKQGLKRKQSN